MLMVKNLTLLILCCFSFPLLTFAGDGNLATGSRSAAVGGASCTYADLWAAFNNQAGLAGIKSFAAGFTNEQRFLVPECSVRGLAVALPVKNIGVFGVSLSYYGFDLYNERKAGISYSRAFGDKVSAGLQIDYLAAHLAEGYGERQAFTVEAGVRATIIKNLVIAAHVFNPTRAKLADYDDERFPTSLKVGLGYTFSEKVILSVESEKNLEEDHIFKAGLEYHIVKQLYLRTGISTNPGSYSFGFGLELSRFKMDLASTYHQVLGFSPQLSLSYSLK